MKPRIIPAADIARQSEPWQSTLREAIRDASTLLRRLELEPSALGIDDAPEFPVLVPEPFLARMRPRDAHDPLLRQVLALASERLPGAGFVADPLEEARFERAPGLLQKYRGRALLLAATACAVHCRYCFRREFPYAEHQGAHAVPDPVDAALRADPSIHEVVLSGGDPLVLRDAPLAETIARLAAIPHLRTVRVHTRLPVVIPSRVTPSLVDVLTRSRLRCVIVVHTNHPNEIDSEVEAALHTLRRAGAILLNQSVLLNGVNDDVDTLRALSERLLDCGTLPYYLHVLDRVRGTAHFEVEEQRAIALVGRLREAMPGYLVPRLVREVPGDPSKRVLR